MATPHFPEAGVVSSHLRDVPEGCLVPVPFSVLLWQDHLLGGGAWVHFVFSNGVMAPTARPIDPNLAHQDFSDVAMKALAQFHFRYISDDLSGDGVSGCQLRESLKFVDHSCFNKLMYGVHGEKGVQAKEQQARRVRAHRQLVGSSPEEEWVPHVESVDHPRGHLKEPMCMASRFLRDHPQTLMAGITRGITTISFWL
jgi:hypothetical protein